MFYPSLPYQENTMANQEINLPERLTPLKGIIENFHQDQQVKHFFEEIIQQLPVVMAVERCSLFLHDPVNQRIMLQYGTGLLERELTLPMAGSLAGDVIQTGIPRIVEDLTPFETIQNEVKQMTGFQTNTMLCVPIHHPKGNCCAGAIQLLNPTDNRRFDIQDLNDLAALTLYFRPPIEELIQQHLKFLQELEKKKKKDKAGLVASFLSKWLPVNSGSK
ncbi:MAG: GAF domain-containing protein [Magnetococcales bacterium]|nr:GAF domain-containing protein [Magnetococcales bacterium]NGZ28456.1 GAF domain-containing protein [Magnetococcales bacterium]